ncbi:short-chain dehydrogenase/reductase [Chitinophaga parva]|uniref:Short-chain dehydrogenase/reductase n=1 Tax=Chitinophaga parva TaxID=2169414 RepID=A0A2T7BLU7_9BACT|nr:SDR family oxidoreductase [Chitinophaga parva]PUZ28655.1 short-chain dehydrogenase/reductase [Chitinophaga parva]
MAKTVLVTGASSGFGKETAKLFHMKGWNVIATMRSSGKDMELPQQDNILVFPLDVTDKESITNAVEKGVGKFGTIDVLVNNAGYGLMGVFEAATEAQIQRQYDVNVFGAMRVTKAVLPFMRKNRSGIIINISSFGGVTAGQFASLYNSSKFALEGFSEALSHELAFLNIAVKVIEPGSVATNFRSGMEMIKNEIEDYNAELATFIPRYTRRTEHLRKATPEEVAETIYHAATDSVLKLRYAVGDDARFYIDLKTKNSEEYYLKAMRD